MRAQPKNAARSSRCTSAGSRPRSRRRVVRSAEARRRASLRRARFPIVAGRAIRVDVLDRVTARLRSEDEEPEPTVLASWLGCSVREVQRIVRALHT